MISYKDIIKKQPDHAEVFFAFSDKQFEEGKAKIPAGKQIFKWSEFNMFGTREGLDYYKKFYQDLNAEIKAKCTPEEIYRYEFFNNECAYTHDDSKAVEMVKSYFPDFYPSQELYNECCRQSEY